MFFKGSRYAKVGEHEWTDDSGRTYRYKKIRFIPDTAGRRRHIVAQGERLDHIAHRYYRDPERFWRIADANAALWPDDLVATTASTILIPASES
jgi:nucleoid-associated protein YgaU